MDSDEEMMGDSSQQHKSQSPSSIGSKARNAKILFRCQICTADSIYHYYGVQSCEGCKQFFRRIIVKQKEFKCWKAQKCDIEKGERCRSCRLDRCLLMGMDPKMVNIRKTAQLHQFVEALERRRQRLIDDHRMDKFRDCVQQSQERQKSDSMPNVLERESSSNENSPMQISPSPSQMLEQLPSAGEEEAAKEQKADHAAGILQPLPVALWAQQQQQRPQTWQLPELLPAVTSFKLLDSLLIVESCLKRIWFSDSKLPTGYQFRHQHMGQLLADPNNLLAMAKQFSEYPLANIGENTARLKTLVEAHGFMFPEHFDGVIKDRFLCVEMAKAMPFFINLAADDQIILLRHIVGPVTMFINAFYSYLMKADTWTRSDGFSYHAMWNQKYGNDERVAKLSRQMFCESVDSFKRAAIGREEFVLLMAILFSSSTAANLSASARDLLYDESVRYSKALLSMLQVKHGHINGSQKYALALELLGAAFQFDFRMHLLCTYTEVFYDMKGPSIFPPVFQNTPLADP